MTIADKIKATMNAPIDDYFKSKVTSILTNYAETNGISDQVFEFYFDYNGCFRNEPRCVRHNAYENGRNKDLFIYLIHIPLSYENRKLDIESWILTEGFERVVGNDFYTRNFCFRLLK